MDSVPSVGDVQDARELLGVLESAFVDEFLGHGLLRDGFVGLLEW
jgi:hypothetical protein